MKTHQSKIALITGASRGLGKEVALHLAAKGVNIIFTYHSNHLEAQSTLEELEWHGVNAKAIQSDSTNTQARQQLLSFVQDTLEQWDQNNIHYLINNAGTNCHQSLESVQEEHLDAMYNIHVKSVMMMCQLFSETLADGGRIINIGSGTTRFTIAPLIAYATMKGATETLTKYLAKSLAQRGVTVNAVAPGALDTGFNNEVFDKAPHMKEMISSMTALGRIGEVKDIAGVIGFLCSNDANWVTGQRIEASGGMFL
jgi:NAD(P)-dependent dehydrogenase (short-subunit alcohol dehydrogenase family)